MEFINRTDELKFLHEQYEAPGSSFVVVYGRRRIGKTTLIREYIRDKSAIYFLASEESEVENINSFKQLVAEFTGNQLLSEATSISWDTIFTELVKSSQEGRVIIVIDEFQYLCLTNSAFPSIMQRIWDLSLKDSNIMLIICGSHVSMMESFALSYKSPLYGRRTGQIRLKQIPFRFYHQFNLTLSEEENIQRYSITGGVPRYIEAFGEKKSLIDNIKSNILSTTSFLYEEPIFLLEREVGGSGTFFSILKAVSQGNHKLSAISSALQVSQTSITRYLSILIKMDILSREVPITENNPEKSKKGLYYISDNFIAFWFNYVYPYRSSLEMGNQNIVVNKINDDLVKNHVSYIYEKICCEYLIQKSAEGVMPFELKKAGRWWNRNTEIDIVGLNDDSSIIAFCECKYSQKPIGINILFELKRKALEVDWTGKDDKRFEYYILFSCNGFDAELLNYASKNSHTILVNHLTD